MGAIRVRMKQGDLPGDPSAFNAHGAKPVMSSDGEARVFPRLVYPGDEIDIPDDLLDDKEDFRMYKHKDGKVEMVTEKKFRELTHKHDGYRNNSHYGEAAPPARNSNNGSLLLLPRKLSGKEYTDFLKRQEMAVLKYRHFNPICMELISEVPVTKEEAKAAEKAAENSGAVPAQDISKLSNKDAITYIRSIKDESQLNDLSIILDKMDVQRPALIQQVEMQLRTLRGA